MTSNNISDQGLNRFNWIAPVYDPLVKLVFGKSIYRAQVTFLGDIRDGSNILILGGGTGWILNEILQRSDHCVIWYIDASAAMVEKAKARVKDMRANRIEFIHGTVNALPEDVAFDIVITNFYLDLFPEEKLKQVMERIRQRLTPTAFWFVSDFVHERKWQPVLSWVMYQFFRVSCGVEASKLPDWRGVFSALGFKQIKSANFFNSFIVSAVFEFSNE